MSLLDRLRAVDEQQVPRLARGLRGLVDRARHVPVPPALVRLDDRLAARGPLARVRRTPSLAAGALALLLLTGGLAAVDRSGAPGVVTGGPRTAVGPGTGEVVEDYLAIAGARLAAAEREGEQPATALVSLDPALPAVRAQALARGLEVHRGYVQEDVGSGAALRTVDAARLQALADASPAGERCPCLVALLVRGPGTVLGQLPGQDGVRAVEATAAQAADVDVRLLLPGVQGRVSEAVQVPDEGEGT